MWAIVASNNVHSENSHDFDLELVKQPCSYDELESFFCTVLGWACGSTNMLWALSTAQIYGDSEIGPPEPSRKRDQAP